MAHAVGDSSFFPVLTGLYRCRCGFEAVTEGRDADTPPADWTVVVLADGTHEHLCPHCSEAQPAGDQ
jgi:predicted RNA-binding Zn-ribbon protein involved in translation (DUF1610 family)